MQARISSLALILPLLAAATPVAWGQCGGQELPGNPTAQGDNFGWSCAASGDRAVVGAPNADPAGTLSGRAYIFRNQGIELGWIQEQALLPLDPEAWDNFGWSVAIDGTTALVGAYHKKSGGIQRGAAYVFEKQGSWVQQAKLQATDGQDYDLLGASVAIDGDVAVVGAWGVDGSNLNEGAAYVFERNGTNWVQAQKLTAGVPVANAYFGWAVAIDGERIVVGAPDSSGFGYNPGTAHFFEKQNGLWVEVHATSAGDATDDQGFGRSVAISGDTALIAATRDADQGADSGSAYVFRRQNGAWAEDQELHPSDGDAQDFSGWSVVLQGSTALIGSPAQGPGSNGGPGAAYLFLRQTDGWAEQSKLVAYGGSNGDNFGFAVGLSADTALVGAVLDDSYGWDAGSATFYGLQCGMITPFCFCDSAAPCGNANGGAGCTNSTGTGGLLTHVGSSSTAADDLVLTVSGLPSNQFALIYMGGGATELPFGDGERCVQSGGAGVYRFPVRATGAGGSISEGPGIVAYSHAAFPAPGRIEPGDVWNFQGWYRDPGGPCGSGFNLSNAIEVKFTF